MKKGKKVWEKTTRGPLHDEGAYEWQNIYHSEIVVGGIRKHWTYYPRKWWRKLRSII